METDSSVHVKLLIVFEGYAGYLIEPPYNEE
jgi:hypothetical protein